MADAEHNPTAQQYFDRINKQKRDARDKQRDSIYDEVDRDLRKQPYWHGKKTFLGSGDVAHRGPRAGWEEVSLGKYRWRPTKAR